MSKTIPQTLKGFRDFLPEEKKKRDEVMAKIVAAFRLSGFEPLETPTLEYRETIMGKYGDEADKLVYSFMDRGDRAVALRYDQTVPTARVIASYKDTLPFPFRRYQTQNVFRADKPQKGRYREFTQCDIDIFGSSSYLADAEILACTYQAYMAIGFSQCTLLVNDRALLMQALEPFALPGTTVFSIIQTIDKLDKLAKEEVIGELVRKGLSNMSAQQVLATLDQQKPSKELEAIITAAVSLGVPTEAIKFSPALARGLDYYTGMIFEVVIPGYSVGSVGGGGRYDNLINQLCGVDVPAVGMAFGFDRTVDAADKLGIGLETALSSSVLVTLFNEDMLEASTQVVQSLRKAGIQTELYPGFEKLSKQLKYADRKGIKNIIVIGPSEWEKNEVVIKDLKSGGQRTVSLESLPVLIKEEQ